MFNFPHAPAKQFFRLQIVEAEFSWPDVSPARKESSGGGKHNALYSVYSLVYVRTGIAGHFGGFVRPFCFERILTFAVAYATLSSTFPSRLERRLVTRDP